MRNPNNNKSKNKWEIHLEINFKKLKTLCMLKSFAKGHCWIWAARNEKQSFILCPEDLNIFFSFWQWGIIEPTWCMGTREWVFFPFICGLFLKATLVLHNGYETKGYHKLVTLWVFDTHFICGPTIANHNESWWCKRPNHTSLLWAQELKAFVKGVGWVHDFGWTRQVG